MKKFNILNNQQIIHAAENDVKGLLCPKGAAYGKLALKYTVKINTGKTVPVISKGVPVFNANGTPKTHTVYRCETRTQQVCFAVFDFKPQKFADAYVFKAFVFTPEIPRWHESFLCRNAWMKELNNFISSRVREYCAKNSVSMPELWLTCNAKPKINQAPNVANIAAGRREVQKQFIFKGGEGGLIRASRAINEEVRFAPSGASVKGVFARHKNAFGVKTVNDPKKDAPEPLKHGFVCVNGKNSRVVYPTAKMAIAANHVYKHGKGDDAGICLDADKIMAVRKV